MKFFFLLCILFIFLLGTGMADAGVQGENAPEQILRAMVEKVATIQDYRCTFIKTEKIKDQLQTEEIVYTFKSPKYIRMDWIQPKKSLKVYFDGNTMKAKSGLLFPIKLDPRSPLGHSGSNHYIDESDLLSVIGRIADYQKKAIIEKMSCTEERVEKRSYLKVEVVMGNAKGDGYCRKALFWIEPESKLPYILEFYDNDLQLFERFVYQDLKINNEVALKEMQL